MFGRSGSLIIIAGYKALIFAAMEMLQKFVISTSMQIPRFPNCLSLSCPDAKHSL